MKTYVLMLSRVFPATHPRKGEPTNFRNAIRKTKLHTIRASYKLWSKRFKEIEAGNAVLSVRQWSGEPYKSRQIEIARFTREDGIGIQRLTFTPDADGCILFNRFDINGRYADIKDVASNDGLSFEDWREWFRNYDLSKPLAIIHFTEFRY